LYPFGHGLSYTNFQYSALNIQDQKEALELSFQIKNTGKMDGDEVAQVYVKMPEAMIPMPIQQLKGFQRIKIDKGQSQTVVIKIDKSQLRYWDEKTEQFLTPKGTYQIMVGTSSQDIRLKQSIQLN
jgi:beta-glucosidase